MIMVIVSLKNNFGRYFPCKYTIKTEANAEGFPTLIPWTDMLSKTCSAVSHGLVSVYHFCK